jgi:molybdate transport system ATP-binding protein
MTIEVAIGGTIGTFEYDIELAAESELLVLYGHSGAGKTITLRAIAGLDRPERGRIRIAGRTVFDTAEEIDLRPQDRRAGYVVQDPTLFPHLTVEENVMIGVEDSAAAVQRYRELGEVLHIDGLGPRRPYELSGGQQQRVALARALVRSRICCCSTSRSPRSTRSCGRGCAVSSCGSSAASAYRLCS